MDEAMEVTPCVGVWIETLMKAKQLPNHIVTPCVGVWIETGGAAASAAPPRHTLRGCVDWNEQVQGTVPYDRVTPCVGVWIETYA